MNCSSVLLQGECIPMQRRPRLHHQRFAHVADAFPDRQAAIVQWRPACQPQELRRKPSASISRPPFRSWRVQKRGICGIPGCAGCHSTGCAGAVEVPSATRCVGVECYGHRRFPGVLFKERHASFGELARISPRLLDKLKMLVTAIHHPRHAPRLTAYCFVAGAVRRRASRQTAMAASLIRASACPANACVVSYRRLRCRREGIFRATAPSRAESLRGLSRSPLQTLGKAAPAAVRKPLQSSAPGRTAAHPRRRRERTAHADKEFGTPSPSCHTCAHDHAQRANSGSTFAMALSCARLAGRNLQTSARSAPAIALNQPHDRAICDLASSVAWYPLPFAHGGGRAVLRHPVQAAWWRLGARQTPRSKRI